MAAFTDQFNKRDPLTFKAFGLLGLWPRQAAWEARSLLEGYDRTELDQMARNVETVIQDQVAHLLRLPPPRSYHTFVSNPMTIDRGMWVSGSPEGIRNDHGDVNLFVAASTDQHPAGIGVVLPFKQWEGLAVIALWKLVDFYEVMSTLYRLSPEGIRIKPSERELKNALRVGAPMVIEATRACTLAAEGRMRLQQLAAMKTDAQRKVSEALYEAETLRRQEVSRKSRDAVMVRHGKTSEHQAEALRLANSKYFPKRAAAARYAADRVEKTPGETYTVGVVDGWLKAAGWRPSGEVPTA